MERQQWQSWRINVHAKNFNFKLRAATSLVPNCNFCRFSFVLKLRKFVFKVDSDPIAPISEKNRSLKTGVVKIFKRFLQKFRPRMAKNGAIVVKRASNIQHPKGPIGIGLWVVGFLALLAQFIYKRDEKGIMILTCVACFIASLFKTCNRGKYMIINITLLLVLIAALVARFQFLDLENYSWNFMGKYVGKYASEQAREAWNRITNI